MYVLTVVQEAVHGRPKDGSICLLTRHPPGERAVVASLSGLLSHYENRVEPSAGTGRLKETTQPSNAESQPLVRVLKA